MENTVELTVQDVVNAAAVIAGQQFVSAVMAEARAQKLGERLATLQTPTLQPVASLADREDFLKANS